MSTDFFVNQGDVMAPRIRELIEEVVQAYHRLTRASDRLHAKLGLNTSMRSVLLTLEAGGPQSISTIAECRSVSRQFMQRLVQEMVREGWLTLTESSTDRRASVASLTMKSKRAIARLHATEDPLFASLQARLSQTELACSTNLLRKMNALLAEEPDVRQQSLRPVRVRRRRSLPSAASS